MVRQDKITFLISTLRTPELYASLLTDEFVHERSFLINNSIDRVLKRIGVVRKREEKQVEILTKYIPVNKHQFLKKALIQFSEDYCFESSPLCNQCYLDIGCDYNNKKNDWL